MWKWVVGTAIITAIVAIVITWQAQRCEAERDECQAATAANPLTNPMVPIVTRPNGDKNQQQAKNHTSGACAHANTYLCRVLTTANLPTIYLVLIGIGGIAVAMGTLKILEQQTEAALLNAKAVISNERPWVMLEIVQPDESYWNTVVLDMTARGKPIFAVPHFRNYGNTPAWIVRSTGFLKLCDDSMIEAAIDYGNPPTWTNPGPLPQGKDVPPLMLSIEIEAGKILNSIDIRELRDGSMYLLLYGFVEYRDPFFEHTGEVHITKFSYKFLVLNKTPTGNDASGRWMPYGPRGANKNT